MSPGVSHGRVATPAGLDSRADVHLASTLPCSTVQKLGVLLPAHHSLPWDVQVTPPERQHQRSSRRCEGEARPVTPDLRKHSGGLGPDPRPAPDARRAHLKRAARTRLVQDQQGIDLLTPKGWMLSKANKLHGHHTYNMGVHSCLATSSWLYYGPHTGCAFLLQYYHLRRGCVGNV
jgi:hypothetical protein